MEHEILLDVRRLTHSVPLGRKTAVKAVDLDWEENPVPENLPLHAV